MAKVSVGQILGLVEAVDEVGGLADAATISREVEMDVDRLGPILTAAEFLGLVTIEDGDIRITELSRKLLTANVRERKRIVREIIDDMPAFRLVMEMARSSGAPLGRQQVVQALADRVGSHGRGRLQRPRVLGPVRGTRAVRQRVRTAHGAHRADVTGRTSVPTRRSYWDHCTPVVKLGGSTAVSMQ